MLNRLLLNIKHRSKATLRAWSYQCESIIAQRSRRIQQLFTFYHRVYGGNGLKQLLHSYRIQFQPPFRGFLLSAVGAAGFTFDWDAERINVSSFDICDQDIDFIDNLHRNKPCDKCRERNIKYCYCYSSGKKAGSALRPKGSNGLDKNSETENPWEPYISKDEFTIWKREEGSSLYSYKVYARFDDVTACELLEVQTDLEYRKKWDDSAVRLELIETDFEEGINSHLIYWEMQWPKMFANRDYVFCRRFISDKIKKAIMLCNRSTTHPKYPQTSKKVRVTEYWSYTVIKPYRNFNEPGVHYIITYFDDPGLAIPQPIKSWVTQSQMPEYLKKMHLATKNYVCKENIQTTPLHNLERLSLTKHDYMAKPHRLNHFSGRGDLK